MGELTGVLDANLIATALVSGRGPGSRLLSAARDGRFELIVSSYLLAEVGQTLRESFGQPSGQAAELLEACAFAARVEPTAVPPLSRDPADDPIVALAVQSGADFLATYDHDLMALGSIGPCGIVHPVTALQLVDAAPWPIEDEAGGLSVEDGAPRLAYAC